VKVDRDSFEVEAEGEVVKEDGVLVIRRIVVRYRLRVPEDSRALAERVHGFHMRACPVARSLEGGIEVGTELELV
jgi:organic hydroperoxide reductase OsmC/OhrA